MEVQVYHRKSNLISKIVTICAICMVCIVFTSCSNIDHIKALRDEGIDLYESEEYTDAISQFDEALRLSGDKNKSIQTDIRQYKAYCEYLSQDYADAEITYDILISENDKDIDLKKMKLICISNIGEQYMIDEDYQKAYDTYDRGYKYCNQEEIDDDSITKPFLVGRGISLERLGKYQDALDIFEKVIDIYGEDDNISHEIAFIKTRIR